MKESLTSFSTNPEVFIGIYNPYHKDGVFPVPWKRQILVLIPKGKIPSDEPS